MKKLLRNPERGSIAGVCQGLGFYFNTDPILVRAAFVLSGLLFPPGAIITYVALWVLTPKFSTKRK
jgi:phage shock protein PspC (stress-responsive transcriptional regulator)